jgi:hypothetical protein
LQAAQHTDGEYAADIFTADRGLDWLDHDQKRPGNRRGGDRDGKGGALDLDRIGRHELQRQLILRHRHDRAPGERARQVELQQADHQQRNHAGHDHAERQVHEAVVPRVFDVGGLHVTIVDAEYEDQHHLGDEQQAEEESKPAQSVLAALLERGVVDLIDRRAERVERRQDHDGGEDRIDPEGLIDDIGDVGAEDDERRMGDIDDVEDAERNRDADRHSGVESAEQQARDNRIDEQFDRQDYSPPDAAADGLL